MVGGHIVVLTGTDAQIVRPYKGLHVKRATRLALTGTDAQIVRPYNRYSSSFDGDGRTDRASLQRATRQAGYTSRFGRQL